VLGVDLWDGTPSQVGSFKSLTGTSYPLLLLGSNPAGGNLTTLYGPYDNYIVINKQGIVRYHADIAWDLGNRFHLDEIRGCVDSLVSGTVGVDDPPARIGFALTSEPNPFHARTSVELAVPSGTSAARVTVHDLAGRRLATLWDGAIPSGRARASWDGNNERGTPQPAGVYLIRAEIGKVQLSRRVIRLR
jgi:hypothetical protein